MKTVPFALPVCYEAPVIDRYARPQMIALWSEEHRLQTWLEIELAACAAMEEAEGSPIPEGTAQRLREASARAGPIDAERVREIEARTQHDVIAFLTYLEERLGGEARYLHLGLTSSDIVDSALGILLRDATDLILAGVSERLLPALREKAEAQRRTLMIGRTHGVHAEPVTCGLMFLGSYAEVRRARERLVRARRQVAVGKLSGAVGVYGSGPVSPEVERRALSALGLAAETVATQVVPRDRHAELFLSMALLAGAIERLAVNLRHLQRTEVEEAEEPFGRGQKGSSAMPHKKNPILSENLCGLARLVRAEAGCALENIPLWHERDISHSSVERVIAPGVTTLCDFMVQRAAQLVEGLAVSEERMRRNLDMSHGLCFSEKVMLRLIETGLARQAAYELVQRSALSLLQEGGRGASFLDRLGADPEIAARLPPDDLAACFDLERHLRHLDDIYERTFSEEPA